MEGGKHRVLRIGVGQRILAKNDGTDEAQVPREVTRQPEKTGPQSYRVEFHQAKPLRANVVERQIDVVVDFVHSTIASRRVGHLAVRRIGDLLFAVDRLNRDSLTALIPEEEMYRRNLAPGTTDAGQRCRHYDNVRHDTLAPSSDPIE